MVSSNTITTFHSNTSLLLRSTLALLYAFFARPSTAFCIMIALLRSLTLILPLHTIRTDTHIVRIPVQLFLQLFLNLVLTPHRYFRPPTLSRSASVIPGLFFYKNFVFPCLLTVGVIQSSVLRLLVFLVHLPLQRVLSGVLRRSPFK